MLRGRVAPTEAKECISLPDVESPFQVEALKSYGDYSTGLRAHRHIVASHVLLGGLIAGSVPSGNR